MPFYIILLLRQKKIQSTLGNSKFLVNRIFFFLLNFEIPRVDCNNFFQDRYYRYFSYFYCNSKNIYCRHSGFSKYFDKFWATWNVICNVKLHQKRFVLCCNIICKYHVFIIHPLMGLHFDTT